MLNLHGCQSAYVESVPVTEVFQGETAGKVKSKSLTFAGIRKRREHTHGATSPGEMIRREDM